MRLINRMWKNYNLSITLFTFFLISWIAQAYFQWQEFNNTQKEHNQPAKAEEFTSEFAARTFENWQSEFLQLFAMVVLTAMLIHKGSHESKDNDEEVNKKLLDIQNRLKNLQTHRSSKRG